MLLPWDRASYRKFSLWLSGVSVWYFAEVSEVELPFAQTDLLQERDEVVSYLIPSV